MVSENRYTSPKIIVFQMAILTLIATTGDNAWASFLVHQVLCTSATVWQYRRMFMQFFLRVWVSEYTCRPIIANLLHQIFTTTSRYERHLVIVRHNSKFATVHSRVTVSGCSIEFEYNFLRQFSHAVACRMPYISILSICMTSLQGHTKSF